MTIMHMRISCWIPKATNTHKECVVLTAFTLQQWLHERASLLRDRYSASLVMISVGKNTSIPQFFQWYVSRLKKAQWLLYGQTSLKFRKCTLCPQRAVTCRPGLFVWMIEQKAFISCTELTDFLLWMSVFTARYELNLINNSASCNV